MAYNEDLRIAYAQIVGEYHRNTPSIWRMAFPEDGADDTR